MLITVKKLKESLKNFSDDAQIIIRDSLLGYYGVEKLKSYTLPNNHICLEITMYEDNDDGESYRSLLVTHEEQDEIEEVN